MSAHHYFRDFFYCDSGMIPWLLVCGLMAAKEKSLAELVEERQKRFPCSGEINREVTAPEELLEMVERHFLTEIKKIERMDGLSANCGNWRFSLRISNTEPVVRLNVESYGDTELMKKKTTELLAIVDRG
jgi:phosphomannomutase